MKTADDTVKISNHLEWVQLTNFRCLPDAGLILEPGFTVLRGSNGQGKTSVLEAVAWFSRSRSFRGVPDAALVGNSAHQSVIRTQVVQGSRRVELSAEIFATGRNRILVNHQPISRARDMHELVHTTVFSPDDLALIKGGPAERRDYLDDLLCMLGPRYDAARGDFDRVLRQRNALLRSGIRHPEDELTLEVFDTQLVAAGAELVRGRLQLVECLGPVLAEAYGHLGGIGVEVGDTYETDWATGIISGAETADLRVFLREGLAAHRKAELDRGVTLVGPHHDEWKITLAGMDSRTRSSQGEQRCLALALRLAGHRVVTNLSGAAPLLLLDDVFSELDETRQRALVAELPQGQTLLTTAGVLPAGVVSDRVFLVENGRVFQEKA